MTSLLASQVAPLAASMVVTFTTAAMLGPEGRGAVAFVTALAALSGALTYASVHVGVTSSFRAGEARAVHAGIRLAVRLSLLAPCVLGVAALAAVVTGRSGLVAWQLAVAGLVGGLVCFNLCVVRTGQALGRDTMFRNAAVIQAATYLAATGLLLAISRSWPMVILAWVLSLVVSTAVAIREVGRISPDHPRTRSARVDRIVRRSMVGHIGFAGTQLLFRADVVVLGLLASAGEVGIYSLAVPLAELPWVAAEALSLAAFSRGSRTDTTDEHRRAERRRLIVATSVIGLVGVLVVIAGSAVVLPIALPQYSDATLYICLLAPGVVVQGASRVAFAGLVAVAPARQILLAGTTSAVLALGYVPAVLAWGAVGAAVGSSVLYLIQAAVVLHLVRHESDGSPQHADRTAL